MHLESLLLLVGAISVVSKVENSGSDECFFVVNVPDKRMVAYGNVNWPDKYSSGEICQWVFFCPSDTYCRLRCPDVGLPKTDGCYMDKILVYTNGKVPVTTTKGPFVRQHVRSKESARIYCGRTTINVRSNSTKITMVLISHESSPGGRFRCTVSPEMIKYKKKVQEVERAQINLEENGEEANSVEKRENGKYKSNVQTLREDESIEAITTTPGIPTAPSQYIIDNIY